MTMDAAALPDGVVIDSKKAGNHKKTPKSRYELKLRLQERCPEATEIRKLHPGIREVFVPRRPASARFCILKFRSDKVCQEVKAALHRKHVEPFLGVLKCYDSNVKVLKRLPGVKASDLKVIKLTPAEIKHAKMLNQRTTIDVKFNSTQRELFLRYGVGSTNL